MKGSEVLEEHANVTDTIQSVKDQQYDLLNKLHRELMAVERQLQEGRIFLKSFAIRKVNLVNT